MRVDDNDFVNQLHGQHGEFVIADHEYLERVNSPLGVVVLALGQGLDVRLGFENGTVDVEAAPSQHRRQFEGDVGGDGHQVAHI